MMCSREWLLAPPQDGVLDYGCFNIYDVSVNDLIQLHQELNQEEQGRVTRLIQPADKRRYIIAHAWLRRLLGERLACDPLTLTFSKGLHGKPELSDHAMYFNLSHSGDYVLIGLSHQVTVGIDVERIRPMKKMRDLAQRFFHSQEIEEILALDEMDGLTAFFRCWNRKEAISKSLGMGLQLDFSRFYCASGKIPRVVFPADLADQAWSLHHLDMPDRDYVASIATPYLGYQVRQLVLF